MLYPWMLLGLAGLSLPIIIHLIQRQRLQPRWLSTLRFLDAGDASNAFAPVPQDIWQLLLRLAVLAMLVAVMVRLTTSSQEPGPRVLTVILDQSMSMQRRGDDGRTAFDRCKSQIGDLLEHIGPQDQVSLMLVGDEVVQETGFLGDKDRLKKVLGGFTVSDGGGRALADAARRALERTQSLRQANTCVLVFSDHQRKNFQSYLESPQQADGFRRTLQSGSARLVLVDVPESNKPNLAVEGAYCTPGQVYVGGSGKVTATIRNYSPDVQDVSVGLLEGGRAGESRQLRLGGGESAKVDLAHVFEAQADAACSVGIGDDVLGPDNVFYLPVRVRDRQKILMIAPPPKAKSDAGRTSFKGVDLLAYAVNPGEALGAGGGTNISLRRVTANLGVTLSMYSTVIVYGLSDLPDKLVKDLAAYVNNGGGLMLIPDRTVSPGQFNECYAPLLAGLQLGGLKELPEPAYVQAGEAAVASQLLAPLLRQEWADLDEIHFSAYFGLQTPGAAACSLRAANGDVLAGTYELGRGRVYVQTFSCDVADSSLQRSPAFVPLVQEILSYLGGRKETLATDVIRANEMYRMHLDELRQLTGEVMLTAGASAGPQAASAPAGAGSAAAASQPASAPAPAEARYKFDLLGPEPGWAKVENISRAGNYRVSHPGKKGMQPRWLAVNPVVQESDLAALSEQDQKQVFGDRNVSRVPYQKLGEQFSYRSELFGVLIWVLVALFVIEALGGTWGALHRGAKKS